MDNDLMALMDDAMPKLNPRIVDGFAYGESLHFVDHVDAILREASRTLERLGIKYENYVHVSPLERLAEMTRPRKSRRTYELGQNDFYMIKVNFTLHGKPLRPRYLYIPYLSPDGTIHIKDVLYLISPTFEDPLFSIEEGSVFLPVSRARNTFRRHNYYFMANGKKETSDIYYSKLHHSRVNEAPKTRLPQLLNYILVQHGLTETFSRYFGADILYGTERDFPEEKFPKAEWVKCRSLGIAPKGVMGGYREPELVIMVPKEQYHGLALKSVIASVIYIADTCSSQVFFDIAEFDSPYLWKRVLARFIWASIDDRDAIAQVEEHLVSAEDYIDDMARTKLKRYGVEAENILELFQYIIWQFPHLTINNDVASLRKKRLSVTGKMLYPITSMIFKAIFRIGRMNPARIKVENINQFLDKNWFPQVNVNITSEKGWISVMESTTDQKVFKISTTVNVDSKVKSSTKSDEMGDPSFVLHPDMIGIISWLTISKGSPSARGHLNPFLQLNNDNTPYMQPEHDCYREEFVRLSG